MNATEMVLAALRAQPSIGDWAIIEQVWMEPECEWYDSFHRPVEWYSDRGEAIATARLKTPPAAIGLVSRVNTDDGQRGWTTIDHEIVTELDAPTPSV